MNVYWHLSIAIIFSFLLCQSCRTSGEQFGHEYDPLLVSNTIDNHKATIIFVWASWCHGSRNTFENQVLPYLRNPQKDVGIVLMHFGDLNEIPDSVVNNQIVMNSPSRQGFDKMIANLRFKRLLKGYKSQHQMPMTILVDDKSRVQNYLSEKKEYASFGEVLWMLKEQ